MIIRIPGLKGNTWGTRRLYFVVRAFLFEGGPEYFYDYRIGHGYLLITDDAGISLRSYSWHPHEWPRPRSRDRKAVGLYKIREYIESGIDANLARRGRVWENDPADLEVPEDRSYRIPVSCEIDDIRRLENYIREWIKVNCVGYEIGKREWIPGVHNQISRSELRKNPAGDATAYWVYGQNCFWWAGTMLTDIGLSLPVNRIALFNLGIGITRRFFDNARVMVGLNKNRFVRRIIGQGGANHPGTDLIVDPARQQVLMPAGYAEDIKPDPKAWA
ncbi:hypothetical protein OpiT1DRAFT_03645 [Opitutaceae bacterium TAV1]|nr:hypothetical protein OpiT1DRAFT_03645 [Opitutaceae bacterium TAV1]